MSQQQIDELLGNLQSGSVDIQEFEEQTSSKKVKDYDFRSPKKFTRDQLKFLDNIYDNFARLFSLHLSSLLRVSCHMEVLQVEEEEYREYNNALSDSVLVGVMGLHNEEYGIDGKQILFEMARPLSYTVIDRLLGGDGSGNDIDREYTDIELSVLDYLFHQVGPQMKNAWTNYAEIEHSFDMIETNSRLIQFIAPDEAVVIVVIEMTVDDLVGNVNICLPASALEGLFKLFDSKFTQVGRKVDPEQEKENKAEIMSYLKKSSLTVSGVLGQTQISLQELLCLQRGDVISLNSSTKENSVVVKVENVPWFSGSVGIKKKKYAVRIDRVLK